MRTTLATIAGLAPPRPPLAWWHNAAVWIGFGVYFLAWELPPIFWAGCPWNTLSDTTYRFEHWWHFAVFFLGVAIFALAVHLLLHAPVRYLIAAVVGMLIALGLTVFWERLA